MKAILLRQ